MSFPCTPAVLTRGPAEQSDGPPKAPSCGCPHQLLPWCPCWAVGDAEPWTVPEVMPQRVPALQLPLWLLQVVWTTSVLVPFGERGLDGVGGSISQISLEAFSLQELLKQKEEGREKSLQGMSSWAQEKTAALDDFASFQVLLEVLAWQVPAGASSVAAVAVVRLSSGAAQPCPGPPSCLRRLCFQV